tara:strand:+ start:293 stop:514 length:222 start_codon:yes stop_codon:yes gene_type:complete
MPMWTSGDVGRCYSNHRRRTVGAVVTTTGACTNAMYATNKLIVGAFSHQAIVQERIAVHGTEEGVDIAKRRGD